MRKEIQKGDTVVRTTPFQSSEIGVPMGVGEEFVVVEVFTHSISFNTYGKSYPTKYFTLKE